MRKHLIVLALSSLIYSGCMKSADTLIFQPTPSPDIKSFFQNGIPIGALETKDEFILFTVEETDLFKETYLRVWILYMNKADKPFLLQPAELVKIEANLDGEIFDQYLAESPTQILEGLEQEAAALMILQGVGGALNSLSMEETQIKSNSGETLTVNDKYQKQKLALQESSAHIRNTAEWYAVFLNSFNNGVLRTNTVFNAKSVNGYIYFPLPTVKGSSNWNSANPSIQDLEYSLILNLQSGNKKLNLEPVKVW